MILLNDYNKLFQELLDLFNSSEMDINGSAESARVKELQDQINFAAINKIFLVQINNETFKKLNDEYIESRLKSIELMNQVLHDPSKRTAQVIEQLTRSYNTKIDLADLEELTSEQLLNARLYLLQLRRSQAALNSGGNTGPVGIELGDYANVSADKARNRGSHGEQGNTDDDARSDSSHVTQAGLTPKTSDGLNFTLGPNVDAQPMPEPAQDSTSDRGEKTTGDNSGSQASERGMSPIATHPQPSGNGTQAAGNQSTGIHIEEFKDLHHKSFLVLPREQGADIISKEVTDFDDHVEKCRAMFEMAMRTGAKPGQKIDITMNSAGNEFELACFKAYAQMFSDKVNLIDNSGVALNEDLINDYRAEISARFSAQASNAMQVQEHVTAVNSTRIKEDKYADILKHYFKQTVEVELSLENEKKISEYSGLFNIMYVNRDMGYGDIYKLAGTDIFGCDADTPDERGNEGTAPCSGLMGQLQRSVVLSPKEYLERLTVSQQSGYNKNAIDEYNEDMARRDREADVAVPADSSRSIPDNVSREEISSSIDETAPIISRSRIEEVTDNPRYNSQAVDNTSDDTAPTATRNRSGESTGYSNNQSEDPRSADSRSVRFRDPEVQLDRIVASRDDIDSSNQPQEQQPVAGGSEDYVDQRNKILEEHKPTLDKKEAQEQANKATESSKKPGFVGTLFGYVKSMVTHPRKTTEGTKEEIKERKDIKPGHK